MISSTRRSGIKTWWNLWGTSRNLLSYVHFCLLCLFRSLLVLLGGFVFKEATKILPCYYFFPPVHFPLWDTLFFWEYSLCLKVGRCYPACRLPLCRGQCCLLRPKSLYMLKCLQQSFGHVTGSLDTSVCCKKWAQERVSMQGRAFLEGKPSLNVKYTLVYQVRVFWFMPHSS